MEMLEGLESLSAEALKARGPEGSAASLLARDVWTPSRRAASASFRPSERALHLDHRLQALNGAITPISAAWGLLQRLGAPRRGVLVVAWTTIEHEGWESEEGGAW